MTGLFAHKNIILTMLLLLCAGREYACGQTEERSNGYYLGVFYGTHWPGGDLADRFGRNFSLGGSLDLIKGQKWLIGVEGQFLFGKDVKENIAGGIVTDRGRLISPAYSIAEVDVRERGVQFQVKFGRIHDLFSEKNISGIKWTVAPGWLQHKIRLTDATGTVPFFNDEYVKGYDRLTNGFSISEFIGYQYLEERGRLNLFIGAEFTQAFTQNRRGLSYNTRMADDASRVDLLFGFKAGIQITLRTFRDPGEIWY